MSKKSDKVTLTVKCSYWVNVSINKNLKVVPWAELLSAVDKIDGESDLGEFLSEIVSEDDCYDWEFEIIDIEENGD